MIQSDLDLFGPQPQRLASHTVLLPGFALGEIEPLLDALRPVLRAAPFRHMRTPGGLHMAVALTNCGTLGWVSDEHGYRYSATDPLSGKPWPALPPVILSLAARAAAIAGFEGFVPDACLVNLYQGEAKMGLHQDRDERDLTAPVLSISLGDTAVFRIGPAEGGATAAVRLASGDVCALMGPARLARHGIDRLLTGSSQLVPGGGRINLTLRRAL